jgi:hypothetical protein
MTAPKFGRVEILVKTEGPTKGSISIIKQTFDDCGLMITGDYIIVIIDERDEINNTLTSTGKIFSLKNIDSYRTYSK